MSASLVKTKNEWKNDWDNLLDVMPDFIITNIINASSRQVLKLERICRNNSYIFRYWVAQAVTSDGEAVRLMDSSTTCISPCSTSCISLCSTSCISPSSSSFLFFARPYQSEVDLRTLCISCTIFARFSTIPISRALSVI